MIYITRTAKLWSLLFSAVFLVVGLSYGAGQVSAQTSAQLSVNTAGSSGSIYIPESYPVIAFKWLAGTNFQYSFDGINYVYPIVGDDETEKMADGYNYSALVSVPDYPRLVRFRSSNAGIIIINLIPGLATPGSSQIFTGNESIMAEQVNLAAGANYSELPIISRALWGANESYMNWTPEYWQNTRIIVHHTVFDSATGDYPAVVRSIYYYHAVTLGWGDVGYNYIIDPNGNIYEGRTGGEAAIGGHAYANNAGAIGISFIGDFTSMLPTEAALQAFRNLAAERAIINNFALAWGTTVTGHRDQPQNNTGCPGNALYPELPSITASAEIARQALVGGTIDLARQDMETALASYPDVRLKLTFTNSGLSDEQKLALVPRYSGIKSVSAVIANTVTIEVESWSYYYGYWKDDTYDRVKMLYLIFSLDPNFSNIELLTDFAFVGTYPANTGKVLIGDSPYLIFSRAAVAGSGNIEIRKFADNSLVDTLDVNSAAVSFADRRVYLTPQVQLDPGTTYYATVCNSCIQDEAAQVFAGFSESSVFSFNSSISIKTQADYDGDDYADIAIYYPTTSTWYIQKSSDSYSAQPLQRVFGWSTVLPLPAGDYDGDNKVDIAVFDPQNARWYVQMSSLPNTAAPYTRQFGWYGVTQIPAGDYDGDDKTDIAVFHGPTARWYIQMSGQSSDAGPYARQFGWNGVTPISGGDYDGDGKTDIAVYYGPTSTWYIQMSSQPSNAGPVVRQFGWSGVTPISGGDYDGDGKTDIAIYHEASGAWYIQLSASPVNNAPLVRHLGGSGRIPLLRGDYDGDGVTEIGVFETQTASWVVLYSTQGFGGSSVMRTFGWNGIVPL